VTCCCSRACRSCATKHVTRYKVCWSKLCDKPCKTGDFVNDEGLRENVEKYLNGSRKVVAVDAFVEKGKNLVENDMVIEENIVVDNEKTTNNFRCKQTDVKLSSIDGQCFKKVTKKTMNCKQVKEKSSSNSEREIIPLVYSIVEQSLSMLFKNDTEEEPEILELDFTNSSEDISTETYSEGPRFNMGVSLAKMRERNAEFERCMSPTERACNELRFGAQIELMMAFAADHAGCLMCGRRLETEFLILKHLQLKHKDEYNKLKTVLQVPNVNELNLYLHKAIRAEFSYQRNQVFPIMVE